LSGQSAIFDLQSAIEDMSYRAFKRLLGETSLERKCRFLFGAFILLLITGSFWLYARQTEHLAYDQITTTCRLLVVQIVDRQLATGCRPLPPERAKLPAEPGAGTTASANVMSQALDEFRKNQEKRWPQALQEYRFWTIKATPASSDKSAPDPANSARLNEFLRDPEKQEDNQLLLSQGKNYYYGAVRATRSCLTCHQRFQPDLQEQDLLAVIKIEVPTDAIAREFHDNRALLISTALVTAILIMAGSYLIVRYVIVKPLEHLKEVADAISAGELNLRSEIQTGDEFEDLSHAFNKMLRNLIAMQERLSKVNADLDRKVDELAQANLSLYESNRVKSDFLATMSHELRTPLNSILGFSEVLVGSPGLTEKQQRWAANIQSSGQQLLNLINDVLDLAKIEAGKMQVRVTTFSLAEVCQGMLTMFRQMAEKKNIDLRSILGGDLPPLRQDMVKVQQVLSNLLSNAIKFTPEGGRVTLEAELAPGTESLSTSLRPVRDLSLGDRSLSGPFSPRPVPPAILLRVTDTGVGIAPEEQELVFEKFRQAGNPMTREHSGTGLGLSIVRELTKLLGGEVTLHSELGRGSTFTVRLPVQLSDEARFDSSLTHEGIDLSRAQRVDVRLYAEADPWATSPARADLPALPEVNGDRPAQTH
jgi:signal transduction histidine kinase